MTAEQTERIKQLRNDWLYEFDAWMHVFESKPVRVVKSEDNSEGYEMNRAHVFELENGKFATAIEQGYSCYDSSQAQLEVFPTEEAAMKSFNKWARGENE